MTKKRWISEVMAKKSEQPRYEVSSGKKEKVINLVSGIILYPSLLTPEMLFGKDRIFLVMLGGKDPAITAETVNWQLKINPNLNQRKEFTHSPLYEDANLGNHIKVEGPTDISNKIQGVKSRFIYQLDDRVLDIYKEAGFKKVYYVSVDNGVLSGEGLYNLFWLYSSSGELKGVLHHHQPEKHSHHPVSLSIPKTFQDEGSDVYHLAYIPDELQDKYVREALTPLNMGKMKGGGRYCFEVTDAAEDINISKIETTNPIQSYHPLFYYAANRHMNVAQMSDLHVSFRQNILSKSKVRVIEYEVPDGSGGIRPDDVDQSPEVGGMINVCSSNIKKLMDSFGNDPDVHILLLAGDLVDYIKNVCTGEALNWKIPTVKEIWDTVAIDGSYEDRYQEKVDYATIYSLILYFYRRWQKPIFVVSGNHDCYFEPYGISPRVLGSRVNAGIPADHNLTIYEAVLTFGKTYDKCKKAKVFGNFDAKQFKWFYSVLTPFSSYMVQLPHQVLTGLGWGNDEKMLDIFGSDKQSEDGGHLPRASESISKDQLKIVETAYNTGKKQILLSHFTFASYREEIPLNTVQEGDIDPGSQFDVYDMGTFHESRKEIYQDYLIGRKIHCLLSGHSHRKAVYSVNRTGQSHNGKRTVIRTSVKKYTSFDNRADNARPAVIVTDSAGPIPRSNWAGEFAGRGSARASGAKLSFDDNGNLATIRAVEVGAKPRLAVALDYLDIIAGRTVIQKFESDTFRMKDLNRHDPVGLRFVIEISRDVRSLVKIKHVYMYVYTSDFTWEKFTLAYDGDKDRWVIGSGHSLLFRRTMAVSEGRPVFISIRLEARNEIPAMGQYDDDSNWNFPIEIKYEPDGKNGKYMVVRDKEKAEKPDFGWRKQLQKYK